MDVSLGSQGKVPPTDGFSPEAYIVLGSTAKMSFTITSEASLEGFKRQTRHLNPELVTGS
jgi:hypothetical protein